MKFNSTGYLDAGLHPVSIEQIKLWFVDPFVIPTTRGDIYEGYLRHSEELKKFGFKFEQFIDGSFVSSKQDPGDIDLLGMADLHVIDALPDDQKERLLRLFSGHGTKSNFMCDAYFLPSVPEDDPAYQDFRAQRKYWMGEFGYDRSDRPKGILTVSIVPDELEAPVGDESNSTVAS
ncbi:hypothetical protein IAI18_14720 [Acetobacteraceae bacterium H6797]|nr:hypothetical protein [Acetobacteraceae bacterium H6797]